MDRRIWKALQLFAMLFTRIPMVEARSMLPSAVLLIAYPALCMMWPEQSALAFSSAFVLCQAARLSLRWREVISREARRVDAGAARKRLVGVVLIPVAVLFASQYPALCLHVPSLIGAGFVFLFVVDALDGSYSTVRAYWPSETFTRYARELTLAMLVLHLTYILLNETMIRTVTLEGWLVYYAFLPVLHHVLLTALFRTVLLMSPERERR
ncbi:hypothetical protein [Pseudorhodobacter wandonensis]|jgi:hypothetical protein|uniref:hypothetical protein n=1 Tax=Pseudorhodobacter wandonensis TaxID=1120568 RepID=UPI00067C8391|nr:hypothetical protein [Pseudorhodobacter wandonensis]